MVARAVALEPGVNKMMTVKPGKCMEDTIEVVLEKPLGVSTCMDYKE